MRYKPSAPTLTGRWFDYPSALTGDGTNYWLAAGGTKLRMTPACKYALLATFEAVMERATAPANVGSSARLDNEYKSLDWQVGVAPYSSIPLSGWALSADREKIQDQLIRGCPREQWNALAANTWDLWRQTSYTINWGGRSIGIYSWLVEQFNPVAPDEWVPDTELSSGEPWMDFEIPWSFALANTPCDDTWGSESSEPVQTYAPWNTYTGPVYPSITPQMQWLEGELLKLGRNENHIYIGSTSPQESFQSMIQGGGVSPKPLGPLSEGKLGNWIQASSSSASATSPRRSSSAWAVFQSMLAQMKITCMTFDYQGTFSYTRTKRQYDRAWYLDPSTYDIKCADMPLSGDETEYGGTTTNYVFSDSYIDYLHGAAAYDFKFFVDEETMSSLTLASRPMYGEQSIPDARTYLVEVRAGDSVGGAGKSSVMFYRNSSDQLVDCQAYVPGEYPSQKFEPYVQERLGVIFVDSKSAPGNVDEQGMGGQYVWHRAITEQADATMETPTRSHCEGLLNLIPAPRGFPQPGSVGNISRYSSEWWSQWTFWYPEEPNWPEENPTKYRPTIIYSPGRFGACRFQEKEQGGYPTSFGAGIFGTF